MQLRPADLFWDGTGKLQQSRFLLPVMYDWFITIKTQTSQRVIKFFCLFLLVRALLAFPCLGAYRSTYAELNFHPSLNPTTSQQYQQIPADPWPPQADPWPRLTALIWSKWLWLASLSARDTEAAHQSGVLPNIKVIITGSMSCWTDGRTAATF